MRLKRLLVLELLVALVEQLVRLLRSLGLQPLVLLSRLFSWLVFGLEEPPNSDVSELSELLDPPPFRRLRSDESDPRQSVKLLASLRLLPQLDCALLRALLVVSVGLPPTPSRLLSGFEEPLPPPVDGILTGTAAGMDWPTEPGFEQSGTWTPGRMTLSMKFIVAQTKRGS
jgi:hypothetical protein